MKAVAIFGPPGTGKTARLVTDARSFREAGTKLRFLSHTRAAAEECAMRIGDKKAASTIHSLCYGLLGLGKKSVIDRYKLQGFADAVGVPIGTGEVGGEYEGDGYLAAIERAKSRGISPAQAFDELGRPGTFRNFEAFEASYSSWKNTFGYVDFGDMLVHVLHRRPVPDFDTLFLDESQDLSALQWQVIDYLATHLKHIVIAGDDDQTVYEWGGADPHGMDNFGTRYGARVEILNRSHRVPRATHKLAQGIIQRVQRRVAKQYTPRDADGSLIHFTGLEMAVWPTGTADNPILVLCRDRFKAYDVERKLMVEGIPYRVAGASGVLNRPYGRAMIVWIKKWKGEEISESERHTLYHGCDVHGRHLVADGKWPELFKRGWISTIPMPHFAIDYFRAVDPTEPPQAIISTIHGAKGKEADTVVLYLPSSQRVLDTFEKTPDPEHRLMYVGVTRAKQTLITIDGPNSYPL
jgi:superfamily I DNA/RNA helicase